MLKSAARLEPYTVKTQLVTLQTDTMPIDGAFYEPDEGEGRIKGAALYFHGNTMNFYTGGARFLPPVLTKLGLAVLAFNRRGHARDSRSSGFS